MGSTHTEGGSGPCRLAAQLAPLGHEGPAGPQSSTTWRPSTTRTAGTPRSRNAELPGGGGSAAQVASLICRWLSRWTQLAGRPSASSSTPNSKGLGMSHNAVTIHPPQRCAGFHCPWHNPSDHHITTWMRVIRTDRNNLMERVCPHGIGHPDPDSLEWLRRIGVRDDGVHSCDRCCQKGRPGPQGPAGPGAGRRQGP